MKKILSILAGVCFAVAAIIAIYRFSFRKSIPEGSTEDKVISILRQNDCFVCHSKQPSLPFYSKLPVIGPKMNEHASHAADFFDLEAKVAAPSEVDETTLSMLDHAVSYGNMPILEYRMIHWGTGFNKKENSVLAAWILQKRGSVEPIIPVPDSMDVNPQKARLGEKMFNDTRISLDGTISCATCHILENGGADHSDERVSEGIDGLHGGVNAPTVYNAVFSVRQFWNGRAADLREQAEGPATNPVEMGDQTWEQICKRLSADKELVKEFESLYPGQGLTCFTVTDAIAEFEKTLITPGSRFDEYLKGNADALTLEEIRGYDTFKANACATCHTGIAAGGRSFEKLGIFGDYFADRNSCIEYIGDDDGLKSFTANDADLHKFKVPTLRNITLTAPYFHDGQYQTLQEAVKAMAKYQLGIDMKESDVKAIVTFMNTMTGNLFNN